MEHRHHNTESAGHSSSNLRGAASDAGKLADHTDSGCDGKDASATAIKDTSVTPEIVAAQKQNLAQQAAKMERDGLLPTLICCGGRPGDTNNVGDNGAKKIEGAMLGAAAAAAALKASVEIGAAVGETVGHALAIAGGRALSQAEAHASGQNVPHDQGKAAAHPEDTSSPVGVEGGDHSGDKAHPGDTSTPVGDRGGTDQGDTSTPNKDKGGARTGDKGDGKPTEACPPPGHGSSPQKEVNAVSPPSGHGASPQKVASAAALPNG